MNPGATILLFESGNGVCTGPCTPAESMTICNLVVCSLRDVGFDVTLRNFAVQNIVCSADFMSNVALEDLAKWGGMRAHYEPQVFPGLVYRIHPATTKRKRCASIVNTNSNDVPDTALTSLGSDDLNCSDFARPSRCSSVNKSIEILRTKIVINVFHSGKVIVTGGRSATEIIQVFRWFRTHVFDACFMQVGSTNSAQYNLEVRLKNDPDPLERFLDEAGSPTAYSEGGGAFEDIGFDDVTLSCEQGNVSGKTTTKGAFSSLVSSLCSEPTVNERNRLWPFATSKSRSGAAP